MGGSAMTWWVGQGARSAKALWPPRHAVGLRCTVEVGLSQVWCTPGWPSWAPGRPAVVRSRCVRPMRQGASDDEGRQEGSNVAWGPLPGLRCVACVAQAPDGRQQERLGLLGVPVSSRLAKTETANRCAGWAQKIDGSGLRGIQKTGALLLVLSARRRVECSP